MASGEDLEGLVGGSVNTRRWLEQCGATLEELTVVAAKNPEYSKISAATIPKGLTPKPRPLPMFFYGDEDKSVVARGSGCLCSCICNYFGSRWQ
mmetsp:Transcript_21444/g.38755  ORF Transcript_21444/g.38755 Transcript_21444/m.38755 type:complete len:94 (+) Transcript_21444:132-413(+)